MGFLPLSYGRFCLAIFYIVSVLVFCVGAKDATLNASGALNVQSIYFAGSIRGGRSDAALYLNLIKYIQDTVGPVLTEHVGEASLRSMGENGMTDRYYLLLVFILRIFIAIGVFFVSFLQPNI